MVNKLDYSNTLFFFDILLLISHKMYLGSNSSLALFIMIYAGSKGLPNILVMVNHDASFS